MNKSILSSKIGRDFVEVKCSINELQWIERWLDNYVRSHSLPPHCAGKDAYNMCLKFLDPKDSLAMLESLRRDFLLIHQHHQPQLEDFSFLLNDSETYPPQQTQPQLFVRSN